MPDQELRHKLARSLTLILSLSSDNYPRSPIITATYSGDSTIADIARAISNRIKEPNSIVVFKSLILLHQLIRQGATDAVLGYLSSGQDVLKLRNVTGQSWEGYKPPKNLAAYAAYLNSRITNYRVLKHDPVRAQSENARSANQYDGVSCECRWKYQSRTICR